MTWSSRWLIGVVLGLSLGVVSADTVRAADESEALPEGTDQIAQQQDLEKYFQQHPGLA